MAEEPLTITILGSGTSSGVPVIGCDCPVCRSAHERNARMRCSALLAWGEFRVLIDTATDLRQQALVHQMDRVDAVLYTHAHADHVNGIDDLRCFNALSGKDIPVYGASWMIAQLQHSFAYVFRQQNGGFRPRLTPRVISGPFELFGRLVVPVTLRHGKDDVIGYRIGSLGYLTDCSEIPQQAREQLQGLDVLVIDGLRFRHHPTHFTIADAIEMAQLLQAKRVILTHLSHDVEYVRDSSQLPEHVEFAYDGLSVTLGSE
ncbi:GPMC system MBL fold metallohydrolase [Desulfuromonas acetoxidans]|uniref:Beta-lactamase-like n=1 Tax=Desulfuromonas acetoxidans (strain DSM 684 / 11070) TaxID=281689 RepID=Q1JVX8_DESA6|nr:GPMC system MBL fold metallohydrolase [Desulfuromonas acetoxidans]EAT14388.1 beta-lactamase-like [Desulfuromonas acetoxidans DSM 684]MBF0644587.1 MBL fold metallo-hydrolase [Desulfuromonas acetoxidans]NVD23886.1 MBL fold metallo-hydrolase [Desulfuromonas acetoxidans]NVE16183.1 MBL fold metallo-hydrolase [Desulfuromonas acetoxidans]